VKASEAYRRLYAQTPVPLVTVGADGRITDANPAFCEAVRMRTDEIVGSPFVDQIVAQDRGASRVYLRQSLDKGVAEWAVSLVGGPSVRWKIRSVAFLERVAILMLWTPPTKDVPQTLVPALASLMRRVPGQAVLLLSEDLWVLGSWGMPALGAGGDGGVLGRHLSKVVESTDAGLADLSSALRAELSWSGPLVIAADPEQTGVDTSCLGDLIPAQVVGGSRQGAGFLVLRRQGAAAGAGPNPQKAERLARVGTFAVHVVEGLGDRARALAQAAPGSAEAERLSLELDTLDRRFRDFTEGARSEGRVLVCEMLDVMEARWRPYLRDHGVSLEVERPPELEDVLLDLSGEVATGVLDELIENARVAVGEESERLVTVRLARVQTGVAIRVEDSGPGVSRAHRDALFEPFYSRWPGRLGLGLSVARTQLELRGGRLTLVEPLGSGAAFEALVRVTPEEAVDSAPASVDALAVPSLSGRTVLLLEESEEARGALARILETAGMTVRAAWSGRSALADLTQHGPTDTVVCGSSGDETVALRFLSELRDAFPDLATRTVVISDAASPDQRRDQQSRMECPVLARPIVVQRLLSRLESAILGG
jgi:signal transduction histidine kinase/CheY-like chemotaxis protein